MLAGSAFNNKGVQAMRDAEVDWVPSPLDVPAIRSHDAHDPETVVERHTSCVMRHASDAEPLSALAFQTMTTPLSASWSSSASMRAW